MSETDGTNRSDSNPEAIYDKVRAETEQVLVGNDTAIEQLTIALLTRGHLLLEGVPGVGKTTIANLFAHATNLEYKRIQMTPDVLPADITGTHVYRENLGEFELQRGPIFANLVVADEINRATPKTQSALLESMQERQVTIEGDTLSLPEPFMVVATQNPVEMEGVFELPEAQRDRFQLKITIDLPDRTSEEELLERFDENPELGPQNITQAVTTSEILEARSQAMDVYVADSVKGYVLDLVEATREHSQVVHGASPRASLAFLDGAKARAAIHGRNYAIPDDVKVLSESILAHRLVLGTDAELNDIKPETVVGNIVSDVEVPDVDSTEGGPIDSQTI
ncbi:MoxR family ATPase [Halostagnicola sp. A-GB9-2]|uniref:AAA family ATPase n=1 Tax=Halostagnicola sp. A-GB9-2 TaxID=3048066 RepID=UPI0024BF8FD6|nr:MoxR family ATPase [Halostagnicola sp. A-GB9-2]MDJ1434306.1 MoxR family ATPase [Halostagnicola sp. A-GB9-2]